MTIEQITQGWLYSLSLAVIVSFVDLWFYYKRSSKKNSAIATIAECFGRLFIVFLVSFICIHVVINGGIRNLDLWQNHKSLEITDLLLLRGSTFLLAGGILRRVIRFKTSTDELDEFPKNPTVFSTLDRFPETVSYRWLRGFIRCQKISFALAIAILWIHLVLGSSNIIHQVANYFLFFAIERFEVEETNLIRFKGRLTKFVYLSLLLLVLITSVFVVFELTEMSSPLRWISGVIWAMPTFVCAIYWVILWQKNRRAWTRKTSKD